MKFKRFLLTLLFLITLGFLAFISVKKSNINPTKEIGQKIDSLKGVYVYYNGGIDNNSGRNLSKSGYNYGLKYQCVEFVKRYYHDALKHKMPNTYGHAKDFFNSQLNDKILNKDRDLIQFKNPSQSKPRIDDLLVFMGTTLNPYGHVAIVSKVFDNSVEIIQQNSGPYGSTRATFQLKKENNLYKIDNDLIMGWLRMKD